jgi:hypothetical protein
MENQQLVDNMRSLFAKVLAYDRIRLMDALNNNGFPTHPNADPDMLTEASLMAMQVSEGFRNDLTELMAKYSTESNFKSFASYQNDLTETLSPQQVMGNMKKPDGIFYDAPLFAK